MKAYFNKGPWKLCDSGIDVNCEAGIVATCDDPNTNQHFNACLIASAPDMYEALKEWQELSKVMADCMCCQDEVCISHPKGMLKLEQKRNAALLKAEGREV